MINRDNNYLKGNQHAKGNKPNQTAFKEGHIPWNKGLKGLHLSPGSEFKKGNDNGKKQAIYTITIRNCKGRKKRRFIKIGDNKWEEYAKYIWRKYHQKILKGDVIHHINGDCLDDRLENLIALPRTDHPIFHSRWGLKSFNKEQLKYYMSRYV